MRCCALKSKMDTTPALKRCSVVLERMDMTQYMNREGGQMNRRIHIRNASPEEQVEIQQLITNGSLENLEAAGIEYEIAEMALAGTSTQRPTTLVFTLSVHVNENLLFSSIEWNANDKQRARTRSCYTVIVFIVLFAIDL